MPRLPLPAELSEFLALPNPAVIATLRADGSPHTAPTWYDWEDGRVLLNMDASRVRLGHLRRDPRAAPAPPPPGGPRAPPPPSGARAPGGPATSACSAGSSRSRTTRNSPTSTGSQSGTRANRSEGATARA